MYIQQCLKGITGIARDEAYGILEAGLLSNWVRVQGSIALADIPRKLTDANLDIHVNQYGGTDPSGAPYADVTPFISLAAGAVERSRVLATNIIHPALLTALGFATVNGTQPGYVFYCWVPVALNRAVGVESVAEEIRELRTYRSYSHYQPEGEVAAKVRVPPSQLERWEYYDPAGPGGCATPDNTQRNPRFVSAAPVLNHRGAI